MIRKLYKEIDFINKNIPLKYVKKYEIMMK